ncbi:MAG: DUF2179 domain-containing protein [Chloroflexi bacterium]|nr:DUF2179 domain-containing protein [Chloroflexota bacterium]
MGIFALRVSDMTLDTLRLLFVVRGKKGVAWGLGFFQSVIFVIAITSVLQNLDNPLNIIGYAAGFATGNVVGMMIEERLAIGHIKLSIVSSARGAALAQTLREGGFAVTEIPARGKDGMVSMLSVSVKRKDVARVEIIVREKDAGAFVIAEDVRPLRHGFWRA